MDTRLRLSHMLELSYRFRARHSKRNLLRRPHWSRILHGPAALPFPSTLNRDTGDGTFTSDLDRPTKVTPKKIAAVSELTFFHRPRFRPTTLVLANANKRRLTRRGRKLHADLNSTTSRSHTLTEMRLSFTWIINKSEPRNSGTSVHVVKLVRFVPYNKRWPWVILSSNGTEGTHPHILLR